ncbi:MAG: hypothetical protein Dbin4_02215 [Alphaproteobacteria bacterium]|nr:hypothetical protein [Alphaproteobacteria bacterium]
MNDSHEHQHHSMKSPYKQLAAMTLVHLAIMYVAMFAMINRGAYFYNNINMLYMAMLMAAPVTLLMVVSMRHMYSNQMLNIAICIALVLLTIGSYGAIRVQTGVGDEQFLRAMIPHHSGAILMCGKADIKDPEIITLCKGIMESQQREIDQMEAILKRY